MKIEQILSGIFQIAGDAPELNLNNYTEDEVEKLNDAMIEVYNLAKQAYDTRTENEPSINYDGVLAPVHPKYDCSDCDHKDSDENGCGFGLKPYKHCGDHSSRGTS